MALFSYNAAELSRRRVLAIERALAYKSSEHLASIDGAIESASGDRNGDSQSSDACVAARVIDAGSSRGFPAVAGTARFASGSPARRYLFDWVPVAAVLALLIAVAVKLAIWTAIQPVSFDGAMNLEVARSLAEGNGYRRMYGDHLGFSHAIQTRAPYILPAAAVFAAFGVGVWQSQLVNALYLVALSLLIFVLVRRATSWRWGLAAVAVCLCTPGLEDNGMNGFGEVPALTWWLAALAVLYGADDGESTSRRRCFAAGLLLGVAVVTKTVLLIGASALVLVLAAETARRERRVRPVLAALGVLALGVVLPILLHEIARALAFGNLAQWRAWLRDEWHMIHMQAGTQRGLPDSVDIASKIHKHFGVLVAGFQTAPAVVVAWLALPAALLAGSWRIWTHHRGRLLIATLALFGAIYFVWWLGVTPTEKAWYRRIFNGVLVWELATVLLIGTLWQRRAQLSRAARLVFGVVTAALIAIGVPLVVSSFRTTDLPDSESQTTLAAELEAVWRLPADAPLYGIGWYSMPTMALYAGRRINDLNERTPAELATHSPILLLLDEGARRAGIDAYWLGRYPHQQLATIDDFEILALAADQVRDPFADVAVDAAQVREYIDFHGPSYPYVFGFYEREGDGWRWAHADVEALLKYGGENELQIDVYIPKRSQYRNRHAPSITAWVGDCRLATMTSTSEARVQLRAPLAACAPAAGEIVHVRLVSSDIVESNDSRQLSFVTHGFGFVAAASAPSDTPH